MNKQSDKVLDELLVLRVQDGDKKSLAILVTRWHKKLVAYAYGKTQEMEAARDIVQDSWQAIIKGLYALKDPAKFRVWAFRIVNNKAVNWVRERQKERALTNDMDPEELTEEYYDEPDFGPIRKVVQQLPEDFRTILTLFYQNEYTVNEISEILGISKGTVKSRLFYARKRVKEIYEEINY